jgi:hypothetical protein
MNESPEFLCPSCGTSAFEVIAGTQWDLSDGNSREGFLVMRCLDCLELFYHQLGPEGPYGMPSEGSERILLAGNVFARGIVKCCG